MKYVSETKAGKSISAYVIMKGRRHVATVRVHYGDTGRVLVNVFQDDDDAAKRTAKATGTVEIFQEASANGYGYDKLNAALAGLWIDGHQITDHCERQIVPVSQGVFPHDYVAPKGYYLTNWSPEANGWRNCYRVAGLDYLRDHGYTIVQAI